MTCFCRPSRSARYSLKVTGIFAVRSSWKKLMNISVRSSSALQELDHVRDRLRVLAQKHMPALEEGEFRALDPLHHTALRFWQGDAVVAAAADQGRRGDLGQT